MHRDHDIFVQSIQDKKKVKVTFVINERGDIREGLFGPIFYSASIERNDSDCYYLWDFESNTDNHFLGLPPSQIVNMELSKETFDIVEFFTSKRETSYSKCGLIVNLPKTKGKNLMKRVCKNCEYFMQISSTSEHIWGDCMKPTSSIKMDGKKEHGAFMWADKTCTDFKPKKSPSNSPCE